MKSVKTRLFGVVAAGVLVVSTTSLFGQVNQLVTLDEMGNGYITPQLPFAWAIELEPNSGLSTLRYDLPFAGVAGDVLLQELAGGPLSDILRFDGQYHVYFFSDSSDGPPDSPADVPTLPEPIAPSVSLLEQGPEGGLQYVYYTPAAGGPGYTPLTSYYIISDVPEPTVTMMLGCMGGGLLLLRALRGKGKRG